MFSSMADPQLGFMSTPTQSFGAGDAFAYDSTFDSAWPSANPWNPPSDDEDFRKRLAEA